MKRFFLIAGLALLTLGSTSLAQSAYFSNSKEWLRKAEACRPELSYQTISPVKTVRSVQDAKAFQGWRMEDAGSTDILFNEPFKKHPSITLDFGNHYTGFLTFSIKPFGLVAADAPVRLKFTLAEVPGELNTPLEPYKGGLARSWVQDEIVTITSVPHEMTIPRRLSGRYLKIELLGISGSFDFVFDKLTFKTQTSVTNEAPALASTTEPIIQDIYKVGLNTLKECMQTVYEDGPKRDRRLWIGDLYLEALANAYTFKNHELTKHCLYLLAAFANDEGLLHATLLEKPQPHPQYGTHTLDYCLIYNVALLEYLKETGDTETAADLWPVAVRQIELALRQFSPDWIYDMDKKPQYWLVFDWKDGYDRQASMQGLTIFALQHSYELAKRLGKEKEAGEWLTIAGKMQKAARRHFYDKTLGVMVSGKDRQVSYLSQVWMILSNTLSKKEGAKAMANVMSMPDACYPGCPYAYHYVIEALLQCGMPQEARNLITDYWGSMVKRGADTFWEVYDPNNDYLSPYGFFVINSYCHAWSCTPVYFINKYPEIFQK
ncbi:family 78 glycoside hydrolase catalytic domain [Parabacteroides acidifaciens]|uniref:Glycoside hydrolase n=1 Tax=Parabacteroides acidifaciens TaxID=2290935 RepID=A0A3D8HDG0_9BACT|nr:family 78 glycoside hydrolase catalytic domain [Parabacteroides acidifaciens]MBC8602294.1 family 78 glycoside hydrolase catalytic domain [Parabacteroides acidifaciens]RDU49014.1 glycoside hydrolase [Parabacteroides acidifaciens]